MDNLNAYRDIVEHVLTEYAHMPHAYEDSRNQLVFDRQRDNYLIMRMGWDDARRIHGCIIHVDIIEGKVWIQRDGTERGIAYDLEQGGIAKDDIVLGFHEPTVRQFTGYAVA